MDINGVAAVVTGAASGLGEATARELARRGAKVAIFDRDSARGEQVANDVGGIFCEVDVTSDQAVMAAVVTGAASGLGEATARELARRGAKVAIFDRDSARGEQVASELGGIFCEGDVTSDDAVKAAFDKARTAHGQERILVNCAGVANAAKTVARDKETKAAKFYPMQQFELAIQINLIGTFRCIANAAFGMVDLKPLVDGEKGVIINTASVAAEDGQIGQAAYSASKGGVLAMALPIARDLMNEGIRVNTILPGVFKTPMVAMMPPNVQDALGAQVPFPKRLGQPQEYAALACFLIENVYMNAAAVRLDGGIRMAPR